MLPQRPTGSYPGLSPARKSGTVPFPASAPSYEALRTRVLAKLEDRMDPSASKRMPSSLLRQSLRTFAEQIAEHEARALPKPDRDRLVEEVLAELLGYGPLEELFKDPTVREVMVTGPQAVIVRREGTPWLPANVRYKDENHLRDLIDRLATHADPLGGVTASVNLYDLKMPNGFRAVAVIPPPALGVSPTIAFVRIEAAALAAPVTAITPAEAPIPAAVTGSASSASRANLPGSPTASPRPGGNALDSQPVRSGDVADPLARHRKRVIDRLITKLANLGVYDVQQIEITEFRRVVAAYVSEYVAAEKIYLSDTDQGRLMLEILTTLHR